MTDFSGLFNIRDAKDSDKNFIMATFLRGLYYGDSWFSLIPKDVFMDNYKKIIEAIVHSRNVSIKIACLPDDPDVILGYSILSKDSKTMHWIYVKSAWRKKNIGRSLVPNNITAVTHLSELGRRLMTKYKVIFNPFLIN